ncbi:aminodeoxychorismate synthase component I [Luteolibacter luteus]|uniref:Aminodeoxychorismate synthase component I n=1 Tax=Luteolibacter luteus TaxID=2728835 RepID=A0A858RR81_9BACT|nr:aminodeoxychorismate synthase component I [Luteolibacter luteus]
MLLAMSGKLGTRPEGRKTRGRSLRQTSHLENRPPPAMGAVVTGESGTRESHLSLDGMTPAEVAAALQHLPGLVFFDTSGNLPASYGAPVSIVAARPREILRGSIHSAADRGNLRAMLEKGAAGTAPDRGFPLGGLCGWVGYEGDFVFGDFPEMLVYDHRGGRWHQSGELAREMTRPAGTSAEIGEFRPLMPRETFLSGVRRIHEWIAAGDIYQVNLTQAFEAKVNGGDLFPLYETLRECSPAPLAAYLSLGGTEILSSSPETFLRMSGRGIETRPIKGTRPRFANPDEDRRSAYELQTSPKEIAELVMITDLLRNDLGQVCEFGSVQVAEMLQLETLGQVHHLVSTVTGTLCEDIDHADALAACFPGGSITGAPKKRAMEIIRELETEPRGVYCGAIGYLGYHGESQFNIAIRTLVREGERLSYHVGAGIVADSDPEKEYEETLHKAAGIRMAVERWRTASVRPELD